MEGLLTDSAVKSAVSGRDHARGLAGTGQHSRAEPVSGMTSGSCRWMDDRGCGRAGVVGNDRPRVQARGSGVSECKDEYGGAGGRRRQVAGFFEGSNRKVHVGAKVDASRRSTAQRGKRKCGGFPERSGNIRTCITRRWCCRCRTSNSRMVTSEGTEIGDARSHRRDW